MTEPKRPHHPSREEQAARAELVEARQEIAQAREEIAEAREGIAEAVDTAVAVAAAVAGPPPSEPPETGPAAIDEIIEGELCALGDNLNPYQKAVLADVLRLHFSLRGPQHLLESSGNFNRPVYPSIPLRR